MGGSGQREGRPLPRPVYRLTPRSVAFRVEIGRNPPRDRSYSASRSVWFRLEFGSVWCVVTLRRGACFGCGGSRWGGSRGWRSCESGWTVVGRLCWCSLLAGVVGVAHSRAPRVGGNRGIMRNSNVSSGHGPAPMCIDPPHCTWEPDHRIRRSPEKPVIPTKASHRPAKVPVSHVRHRRQPHPKHTPTTPHTEIGPLPARDRSDSARPTRRRSTHDKLKGESHMPHLKAIDEQQTRGSTTDLGAEPDRSRCGFRPISTRSTTDLGEKGTGRQGQPGRSGLRGPRVADFTVRSRGGHEPDAKETR